MYSVTEDDEYVTYTLMEDQFTLAAEMATVNVQDCFELTGKLDGYILTLIYWERSLSRKRLWILQVSSICAEAYSLSNGSLKVIFPGGIQVGSTEADLLAAYGEPHDTYKDEEYGNSHFWYGDGSYMSSCNASIIPDSGLVEMITIDCEG